VTDFIDKFLLRSGWGGTKTTPLAGDASGRRYWRLSRDGQAEETALLMHIPEDEAASFEAFRKIASYLTGLGLSAPAVFAADPRLGLMVIEDYGDGLVSKLAAQDAQTEKTLYLEAETVLSKLATTGAMAGLSLMTPIGMADMVRIAYEQLPADHPVQQDQRDFFAKLTQLCVWKLRGTPVTVLRDFHADNLIWLPDRDGVRRMGLLDFQDALTGPLGYDLASLVDDARRDIPPSLRQELIKRHAKTLAIGVEDLELRVDLISVQRNLRILGVFARLANEQSKIGYLAHMPRVAGHILRAVAHPELQEISPAVTRLVKAHVPEAVL